jgi:hypothetical protein
MSFTERDFSSLFTKWLNTQRPKSLPPVFVYELKIAKHPSLPFSRIEPHQVAYLYKTRHSCFTYKISDVSPGEKPFDGFSLCNVPAYVVIGWFKAAAAKSAAEGLATTFIDIDTLVAEEKTAARRSITEERAKEIGTVFFIK